MESASHVIRNQLYIYGCQGLENFVNDRCCYKDGKSSLDTDSHIDCSLHLDFYFITPPPHILNLNTPMVERSCSACDIHATREQSTPFTLPT